MESFRAAAATTAPYIEFDVHMTRDGEIVVAHDDHLARMCGLETNRAISEMNHAEVAAADAARMFSIDGKTFPFRDKSVHVPRLADVLDGFPKLRMIIEIKQINPSLVAPMLKLIDRAAKEPGSLTVCC